MDKFTSTCDFWGSQSDKY